MSSSQIRDYNDSDTDSLELDPELMRGGVQFSTVAAGSVATSFTNVLGNLISSSSNTSSQDRRLSGAEDFEVISQEEIDLDQDGF